MSNGMISDIYGVPFVSKLSPHRYHQELSEQKEFKLHNIQSLKE